MGYDFPPGFYGDVRTEEVFETAVQSTLGSFDEMKERSYSASFVGLYDMFGRSFMGVSSDSLIPNFETNMIVMNMQAAKD